MTVHKDVSSVISAAKGAHRLAQRGWEDYLARGDRANAGLITAVTTSRSVSTILQNMKGMVDGFADWWADAVRVLDTPESRWVVNTRNLIEKQGTLGGNVTSVMRGHIDSELVRLMSRNAPRGTRSTFFGDSLGRSGWIVQLDDGSVTQVYFQVPTEVVDAWLEAPSVGGRALEDFFPQYLDTLRDLINATELRFT